MPEKTYEEYKEEERIRKIVEPERKVSDDKYSLKWVENGARLVIKGFYWLMAAISLGILGILGKIIIEAIQASKNL